MTKTITARQATPGTVVRLFSTIAGVAGTEQWMERATVVRWEGRGDGTAYLIVRGARGCEVPAGIYEPNDTFTLCD